MAIIEFSGLRKSYGNVAVLHGLDASVEAGKLVGFLGPNGAGKSTTLRILMGLLQPTSGSIQAMGMCSQREGARIRKEVGYLPGEVSFYPNLTGGQTLSFLASARRRDCRDEIKRLAGRLELPLHRRVRTYSTGMRQKLGLIQALMHRPELLVLDEPTSALDPLVRETVFEELRTVVRDGRSVLFSSHSLNEVESLCDEVLILREGLLVEQQSIDTLRQRALRRVEMEFAETPIPETLPAAAFELERQGRRLRLTWSGGVDELLQWLKTLQLADVIVERPDLNDLFLTYYRDTQEAVP